MSITLVIEYYRTMPIYVYINKLGSIACRNFLCQHISNKALLEKIVMLGYVYEKEKTWRIR